MAEAAMLPLVPAPPAAPRPGRHVAEPAYVMGRAGAGAAGKAKVTQALRGQVAAIDDVTLLEEAEAGLRGVVAGNEGRRRAWIEVAALEAEGHLVEHDSLAAEEGVARRLVAACAAEAWDASIGGTFYSSMPAATLAAPVLLHTLRTDLLPAECAGRGAVSHAADRAHAALAGHHRGVLVTQCAVQDEPYARAAVEIEAHLQLQLQCVHWALAEEEIGARGELQYDSIFERDDLATARLQRWEVECDELCHREALEEALLERLLLAAKTERLWRAFMARNNPREPEATHRAQLEGEEAAAFRAIKRERAAAQGVHALRRMCEAEAAARDDLAHHAEWALGRIHLLGHRQWMDTYALQTYLQAARGGLERRHGEMRHHVVLHEEYERGELSRYGAALRRAAAERTAAAATLSAKEATERALAVRGEAAAWKAATDALERCRLDDAARRNRAIIAADAAEELRVLTAHAKSGRRAAAKAAALREASYLLLEHDEPLGRWQVQREWLHTIHGVVAKAESAEYSSLHAREVLFGYEAECRDYVAAHERASALRLAGAARDLRRKWGERWERLRRNATHDLCVEEGSQRVLVAAHSGRALRQMAREELLAREGAARRTIQAAHARVARLNFAGPLQATHACERVLLEDSAASAGLLCAEAERRGRTAAFEAELRRLLVHRAVHGAECLMLFSKTKGAMARGSAPRAALEIVAEADGGATPPAVGLLLQCHEGDERAAIAAAVARGGMRSTAVVQELHARRRDDLAAHEECARLAVDVFEEGARRVLRGLLQVPLQEGAGRRGVAALEASVRAELGRMALAQEEGAVRYQLFTREMRARHDLAEAALNSFLEAVHSPPRERAAPTDPSLLRPFHARAIARKEASARDATVILEDRIWQRAGDAFAAELRRAARGDSISTETTVPSTETGSTVSTFPPIFAVIY
eukprot:TRINITY_DN7547_c0_g4_i2.p1 TRINITY_DN7547_c0_g4~~TRINITY_DN7547_c0_g4_i2.p1  ORF type:complete len:937 (+),score=312.93 TRINITY_DN7547_c0_g4_i2:187-2997(+)